MLEMVTKEHIRQSNLIEGIDDPLQDGQAMVAWQWLSQQRKLDAIVIKKAHKILMDKSPLTADLRGTWRPHNVRVGSHVAPDHKDVPRLITHWVKTYRNYNPQEAHIQFEVIHPFADGNGRTGRMLLWWHQISLGKKPQLLQARERQDYYAWFRGRGNNYEALAMDYNAILQSLRDL